MIPDSYDVASKFDVYLAVNGSECGIAPIINVIPDISGIALDSTISGNVAPGDFGIGSDGTFGSGTGTDGTTATGGGTTGSTTSGGGTNTGSSTITNTDDDLTIIPGDDDAPTCF